MSYEFKIRPRGCGAILDYLYQIDELIKCNSSLFKKIERENKVSRRERWKQNHKRESVYVYN